MSVARAARLALAGVAVGLVAALVPLAAPERASVVVVGAGPPPARRWVGWEERRAARPIGARGRPHYDLAQAGFPGADDPFARRPGAAVAIERPSGYGRSDLRLEEDGVHVSSEVLDVDALEAKVAGQLSLRADDAPALAFDAWVRFGVARRVLRAVLAHEASVSRVRFLFEPRGNPLLVGDAARDARVVPRGTPRPLLALALRELGPTEDPHVHLRLGRDGPTVALGSGPDPEWRDEYGGENAAAALVSALLEDAVREGARGIALDVDPQVRWLWVAQTLSLAWDAGLSHVEIEGLGPALRFEAPPPVRFVDTTPVMTAAMGAPALLGIGAALALAAALAPWLAGLASKRARGRRRRL